MIKIKIPATSANLGPGYDSLGLALSLYNSFTIQESNKLQITGCDIAYQNHQNLVNHVIQNEFERLGHKQKPLKIHIEGDVPIARGLGSSSTCIIAGIIAANLLSGKTISNEEILNLACAIEGHPDNLAPALYGGITVSMMTNDAVLCDVIQPQHPPEFLALIPEFELSTKASREVLPKSLSYQDAVFNISRSAFIISALYREDYASLSQAVDDRLHQPYRKTLIKNYDEVMAAVNVLSPHATYLSGAGPTIMAIVDDADMMSQKIQLPNGWKIKVLKLDTEGTKVEVLDDCM